MKRMLLTTMIALGLGAGAILTTPATASADDWELRYGAYRNHWNDHWNWRDRYYQPYYRHHYHMYESPYYSSYPRTFSHRPSYGGAYYAAPYRRGSNYGYRDYHGGAVRVGPLHIHWR